MIARTMPVAVPPALWKMNPDMRAMRAPRMTKAKLIFHCIISPPCSLARVLTTITAKAPHGTVRITRECTTLPWFTEHPSQSNYSIGSYMNYTAKIGGVKVGVDNVNSQTIQCIY